MYVSCPCTVKSRCHYSIENRHMWDVNKLLKYVYARCHCTIKIDMLNVTALQKTDCVSDVNTLLMSDITFNEMNNTTKILLPKLLSYFVSVKILIVPLHWGKVLISLFYCSVQSYKLIINFSPGLGEKVLKLSSTLSIKQIAANCF